MSASSKPNQSGAFGVELSGSGADVHGGWGTKPPLKPLSKKAGFSYLTFEHDVDTVLERDTSITSRVFQTSEREVGRTLDRSLSFNNRCEGVDKPLAWMTGWEGKTKQIIVFAVTAVTNAVTGDTFTFEGKTYTFVRQYLARTITNKTINFAVFVPAVSTDFPTVQSGVLEGGSKTDLTFTKASLMYEHLYEVANDVRNNRPYTSTEISKLGAQVNGLVDTRTCLASLAKNFPEYSFLFETTKCSKFGFKWSPAKFTEVTAGWVGYDQARIKKTDASHSDIDYGMDCSMVESNNIFAHNQSRVEIGLSGVKYNGTNYTFYPVTDMNVDVEYPLQKQQDTESGLFLVDPILNGLISISAGLTITQSKDEQFMEWRDSRQTLSARISSVSGEYSQELLIKKFTLPKAGPDGGDVAAEPLTLSVSLTCGGHAFEDWLKDEAGINHEIMGSPILLRVVNTNPYNEMTGRDLLGALRP